MQDSKQIQRRQDWERDPIQHGQLFLRQHDDCGVPPWPCNSGPRPRYVRKYPSVYIEHVGNSTARIVCFQSLVSEVRAHLPLFASPAHPCDVAASTKASLNPLESKNIRLYSIQKINSRLSSVHSAVLAFDNQPLLVSTAARSILADQDRHRSKCPRGDGAWRLESPFKQNVGKVQKIVRSCLLELCMMHPRNRWRARRRISRVDAGRSTQCLFCAISRADFYRGHVCLGSCNLIKVYRAPFAECKLCMDQSSRD
jgi:hypothetical protein